ncbi:unnamed protein product [Ilex paraguariensis]|uniref:DRBM domain-containing protein n=1 Tax=Ilex paraguariensis TaxID=185542 RepID=A0ABC8QR71_9AQUA
MYKTKLQELCHQYSWNLPEYMIMKDGPDHNPRFNSTVVVNGVTFEVPKDQCRSSGESQNQAAKLAFDHFTAAKAVENNIPDLPLVSGYPSPLCSGLSTSNINSDVGIVLPTQQEDARSPQTNRTPLASNEDKRSKGRKEIILFLPSSCQLHCSIAFHMRIILQGF